MNGKYCTIVASLCLSMLFCFSYVQAQQESTKFPMPIAGKWQGWSKMTIAHQNGKVVGTYTDTYVDDKGFVELYRKNGHWTGTWTEKSIGRRGNLFNIFVAEDGKSIRGQYSVIQKGSRGDFKENVKFHWSLIEAEGSTNRDQSTEEENKEEGDEKEERVTERKPDCEQNVKYLKDKAITKIYYRAHSVKKPMFLQRSQVGVELPASAWSLLSDMLVQSLGLKKDLVNLYNHPGELRKGHHLQEKLKALGWASENQMVALEFNPGGTQFSDMTSLATFYLSALRAGANGATGLGKRINNSQQEVYWEIWYESTAVTCWPIMRCVNGEWEADLDNLHVADIVSSEGSVSGHKLNLTPNGVKEEYERFVNTMEKKDGSGNFNRNNACKDCLEQLDKVDWPIEAKWCTFYKNLVQEKSDSIEFFKGRRQAVNKEAETYQRYHKKERLAELAALKTELSTRIKEINLALNANKTKISSTQRSIDQFEKNNLEVPSSISNRLKNLMKERDGLELEKSEKLAQLDLAILEEYDINSGFKERAFEEEKAFIQKSLDRLMKERHEARQYAKKYC